MGQSKIIYQSIEEVYGAALGLGSIVIDLAKYSGTLTIVDSGLKPVTLKLEAERPYPDYVKIPHEHIIQERTITAVYNELIRFFKKYKLEFRG